MIPEENHIIGPSESTFFSAMDNRMQVKFPPNAVDKEENIGFKVQVLKKESILKI